jgi:hypothetical protein
MDTMETPWTQRFVLIHHSVHRGSLCASYSPVVIICKINCGAQWTLWRHYEHKGIYNNVIVFIVVLCVHRVPPNYFNDT